VLSRTSRNLEPPKIAMDGYFLDRLIIVYIEVHEERRNQLCEIDKGVKEMRRYSYRERLPKILALGRTVTS
jgi:hypothetical protein